MPRGYRVCGIVADIPVDSKLGARGLFERRAVELRTCMFVFGRCCAVDVQFESVRKYRSIALARESRRSL